MKYAVCHNPSGYISCTFDTREDAEIRCNIYNSVCPKYYVKEIGSKYYNEDAVYELANISKNLTSIKWDLNSGKYLSHTALLFDLDNLINSIIDLETEIRKDYANGKAGRK